MRIVVVIVSLGDGKYQAQLRNAAGGNHLFFSRRENRSSAANRVAGQLFGQLQWQDAPEQLRRSEPGALQVAYWNGG